jgi:hypothetical protein
MVFIRLMVEGFNGLVFDSLIGLFTNLKTYSIQLATYCLQLAAHNL